MHLKYETTHVEMEAKYGPATHFQIFEIFQETGVCSIRNNSREKTDRVCRSVNFALRNELKDFTLNKSSKKYFWSLRQSS